MEHLHAEFAAHIPSRLIKSRLLIAAPAENFNLLSVDDDDYLALQPADNEELLIIILI